MRTALVQFDIAWADPASNRSRLDGLLGSLPQVDLVVLPEMFSTGFATSPEGVAETSPSASLEWMMAKAHAMDCAMVGSIALHEGEDYFNRVYFVKPDGSVAKYDKHHLFTYSGEHHRFTRGTDRVVVEWRGFRFLLNVCYDLRFPVWSRNRKDYDAAIYVASWPSVRQYPWETLLRARAIENQCFVLGVNRVGKDPSCEYAGGTAAIDPYGATLTACVPGAEQVLVTDLDMAVLEAFRAKFPVLDDADDFEMK
ncbi:MAG: amidohydrolase [Bacteroidales bacterium]|nr:amidohydrolase [Bacteroidales bacterium]